jgi:hypothetical protein
MKMYGEAASRAYPEAVYHINCRGMTGRIFSGITLTEKRCWRYLFIH